MREVDASSPLLTAALLAAVPLKMMRLAAQGGPTESDLDRARGLSQIIGEHGDKLLFKSKRTGESAEVFDAVAEGISILSFCPGGVRLFGYLWCGNHSVFGIESETQVCPQCAPETRIL